MNDEFQSNASPTNTPHDDTDAVDDILDPLDEALRAVLPRCDINDREHSRLLEMLQAARDKVECRIAARTEELQREVGERKAIERQLRDQRAFQAVLAAIRGIGLQEPESSLWNTLLNTMVISFGLRMAWYGEYINDQIRPLYSAGLVDKYLDGLILDIQEPDSPDAQCAMSKAVFTRRPFGYADLAHDEGFARWREYALELGYGSNLAIPLIVEGDVVGGMMVYSADADGFDSERVSQMEFLMREAGARVQYRRQHRIAQEALLRSERMAAVGTLAGGVAHEFNNINVGILGFAEVALERSDLDDDLLDSLQHIRRAALRARRITSSLLTFSGSRHAHVERANLVDVVREASSLVTRDAEKDRIDLDLHLHKVPDTAMDPAQIGQVVLNLLINARHALLDSDERRIVAETGIEIGPQGECVFVRISDTGTGIAEDVLPKIFTPFFTTKGEHAEGGPGSSVKGTGLGLSVSHTIVESHGGTIDVASRAGSGTTFTVRLPVRDLPEAKPARPKRKTTRVIPGARVVVLDDEEDTRDLLSILLKRQGYSYHATADGTEALDWLRREKVDVVIVDIQMSLMAGPEFLSQVATLEKDRQPQAIVISGRPMDDELADIPAHLIHAKILKPFELSELAECIAQAVRVRRKRRGR